MFLTLIFLLGMINVSYTFLYQNCQKEKYEQIEGYLIVPLNARFISSPVLLGNQNDFQKFIKLSEGKSLTIEEMKKDDCSEQIENFYVNLPDKLKRTLFHKGNSFNGSDNSTIYWLKISCSYKYSKAIPAPKNITLVGQNNVFATFCSSTKIINIKSIKY
ncbi:hypothetical protein K6119_17025 [Paracrocinitomix mangrovi]|uniref:hypothetical protein n=1 Tax=Paracrocinitomix mangrovi TaxID=2862509 RepID=UPI001C8E0110|nr:hypothetical protein [Paracrocinitomix mangrovi]UKN01430.1 hypothetical protein K6119_17025 [Paracrocinitomix mangrovi]